MRLGARVRNLERRTGVNAACPSCHDRGVCGTAMWINGVELSRHAHFDMAAGAAAETGPRGVLRPTGSWHVARDVR